MTSRELLIEFKNEHITLEKAMKIIEKDLKFLEIIKKYFYLKFNTYEWGNYITIVGKEDYDENGGIDAIASSDFLEDKDIEFLKKYFIEENN